jgi:SMODS and SLOG-associating 2TM effector domain family 5
MDHVKELLDRIWITEKVRILAEERLLQNDKIAHFATIWYSFLLVVWSLFQEQIKQVVFYADQLNVAISVLLMVVSVSLYGLKFGQHSEYFKNCYHALQRLKAKVKAAKPEDLKAFELEYIDVLEGAPNHSDFDYKALLVGRWWQGNPLVSPGTEKARKPTVFEIVMYVFLWFRRWCFIALVFSAPLIAAYVILPLQN